MSDFVIYCHVLPRSILPTLLYFCLLISLHSTSHLRIQPSYLNHLHSLQTPIQTNIIHQHHPKPLPSTTSRDPQPRFPSTDIKPTHKSRLKPNTHKHIHTNSAVVPAQIFSSARSYSSLPLWTLALSWQRLGLWDGRHALTWRREEGMHMRMWMCLCFWIYVRLCMCARRDIRWLGGRKEKECWR